LMFALGPAFTEPPRILLGVLLGITYDVM